MVTAPKCKVCGQPHWSNQPHIFGSREAAPAEPQPRPRAPALGANEAVVALAGQIKLLKAENATLRAKVTEYERKEAERLAAARERVAKSRAKQGA